MKPKGLDLFSGAGGCSMGYHRAGFEMTGVDIVDQPNYPFRFVQADALEYVAEHASEYALVAASPPCQAFTTMSNRHRGQGGLADSHDELIDQTRELLQATGLPWIIENVVGAKRAMRSPLTLHGGMFGLGVYRPRLFESNMLLHPPEYAPIPENPIGVYGKLDGRRVWTRVDGTEQRAARTLEEAQAAMGGVDWMTWRELAESIPPQYTEFLGAQLLSQLVLEVL